MDRRPKSEDNSPPRCFRHHSKWQANIQWLLNNLRDKLIKKVYIGRFNNLLCTCGKVSESRPEIVAAWEEVSGEHLRQALVYINNYVDQNPDNEVAKIIGRIMKLLRADKEVPPEGASAEEWNVQTSAFKLLFLLKKALEKDFKMMEPRKPVPVQQAKKKMKQEHKIHVKLPEYPPNLVGQLIGDRGRNIMIFMRREKCHVRVETVKEGGKEVVEATIKKTTDKKDDLNCIAEELKKYAEETKKDVESYKPESDDSNEEAMQVAQPADEKQEERNPSEVGRSAASSVTGEEHRIQLLKDPASQMSESPSTSQVQVNTVDYNDPNSADPCPTKCMVHDRRWVSTYQYTITQCYSHIRLPKKFGSKFSRLICTCNTRRPEARLYFITEEQLEKAFEKCKKEIERWPHECQVIMKPLISQLQKYDRSEVWHSLFKFVYYFNAVEAKQLEIFDAGYKLPGQTAAFVPRKEKPYTYQVDVATNEVRTSHQYIQSMNTLSTASSTAAAASTTSSRATTLSEILQHFFPPYTSSSLSMDSDRRTSSREREKVTLKRVRPEEWSDDCYYHGKKKKFAFQCLVNYLHKQASLPVKLNIPFSVAVCVCNETMDQKKFYKNDRELADDCHTMKFKLQGWRGDSKATVVPFVELLEKYQQTQEISPGLLKLVYYFNKVLKRDLICIEDLHRAIKDSRNKKA